MSAGWPRRLANADLELVVLRAASARAAIIEHLLEDAALHDAERYDEIGRRFDAIAHAFPFGAAPDLVELRLALIFWDAWIDARNLGWRSSAGIARAEWPLLARAVAADLTAGRSIEDATVRAQFDVAANGSRSDRVRALAERLQRE